MTVLRNDRRNYRGPLVFHGSPVIRIGMITGLVITAAGVYFRCTGRTTSGVKMMAKGQPYTTGTLDGNAMIFCGLFLTGITLALAFQRKTKKKLKQ